MNFDTIGGRRFFLVCTTQASVTVMRWFDKLDNATFRDLILGVVAAYVIGNVAQRHIEARRDAAERGQGPAA